jgi:hypothetical protein
MYLKNKPNKIILTSCLLILPSLGFSSEFFEEEKVQIDEQYHYLKELLVEKNDEYFSPNDLIIPKSKQGSAAIMGTWLLSYTYNSPHTDKFVLDETSESESGNFFAVGKYYPDQIGNGEVVVCLDYSSTSYSCLTGNNNSEMVAFDISIKGNSITSGYIGIGSTTDIAFEIKDSFQYSVTGSRESKQIIGPLPTGSKSEAIYNETNRELDIPVVDYNRSKFRVILQNQGNFVFSVKAATPLEAPSGQQTPPELGTEARYDETSKEFDIPAVDYKGSKYRVKLQNQGNFMFTVKEVFPL